MMFCSKCGAQLETSSNWCSKCAGLSTPAAPQYLGVAEMAQMLQGLQGGTVPYALSSFVTNPITPRHLYRAAGLIAAAILVTQGQVNTGPRTLEVEELGLKIGNRLADLDESTKGS